MLMSVDLEQRFPNVFRSSSQIQIASDAAFPTIRNKKEKLEAHAIKRVAAGAHLPTPRLSEPAKRPDDRTDYCLDCSVFPVLQHQVLVFTLEWSVTRPTGELW